MNAVAEAVQERPEMTLGEIIQEMYEIREERRKISQRDKVLVEKWRELEAQMIAAADGQGADKVSANGLTATITEETLPQVEDWDALYQYMLENEALYMLQRRVAAAAFRELQDAGVDVPGISPYVQRKISLRKS